MNFNGTMDIKFMRNYKRTAIALSALIALLCAGCAASPEEYAKAEKACESHGGLKYYYVFPFEETHCIDGTVIKTLGT